MLLRRERGRVHDDQGREAVAGQARGDDRRLLPLVGSAEDDRPAELVRRAARHLQPDTRFPRWEETTDHGPGTGRGVDFQRLRPVHLDGKPVAGDDLHTAAIAFRDPSGLGQDEFPCRFFGQVEPEPKYGERRASGAGRRASVRPEADELADVDRPPADPQILDGRKAAGLIRDEFPVADGGARVPVRRNGRGGRDPQGRLRDQPFSQRIYRDAVPVDLKAREVLVFEHEGDAVD